MRVGSRFGKAKMHPSTSTARISITFHRAKYIMRSCSPPSARGLAAVPLLLALLGLLRLFRRVVLGGLGRLGAVQDVVDAAAQQAHLHALRDLDLDFALVYDLADHADDAARAHDPIAALDRADHGLVLLHALALRRPDQEVEDRDDGDEREQATQHTAGAARSR